MNNLCFGMRTINITQLPGSSFSHPNMAMDLAGEDTGRDVWRAQGCWKCISAFGSRNTGNTRLFYSCNEKGNPVEVYLANGQKSIITIALTHSLADYSVGKVYKSGEVMYSEGTSGKTTGNHIHLEVATGIQETKYYDSKLGVYRMRNEVNPLDVMFVRDDYSTVALTSLGAKRLYHCKELVHSIVRDSGAVYRLYNPNNGEHLFTSNYQEAQSLFDTGWNYEGVGWYAGENEAVYRLYNPNNGRHLLTADPQEVSKLLELGWKYEGTAFGNDGNKGVPIYRLYNPNSGAHMYTSDGYEKWNLIHAGWKDEGIAFYGKVGK